MRQECCQRAGSVAMPLGTRIKFATSYKMALAGGLFECISRWRSAWCRNTELSDPADSDTTKEAPHGKYVLHRLRCSQENDQLLCEGCQWSDARRGQDSGDAVRPGPMDENTSPAVDSSDGSHHLHRVDLRSPAAACGSREGGASTDAAGHCCGQEKE